MNIFMNAPWITHSQTAPKGRSIEAQCAALGYQSQPPTIFQALKGRNILNPIYTAHQTQRYIFSRMTLTHPDM